MPAQALLDHIRPGDTVVVEQVLGEPTALVEELFGVAPALVGTRVFVGMSLTDVFTRTPPGLDLVSTVGMAPNGALLAEGRMRLVPAHMSDLPWLLTEGPLRTDVVMVRLSPPDADGWCSLGVTSDYIWPAIEAARVVLAEINPHVPVVAGDTRVNIERVAYSIRSDRPLPEYPRAQPAETDRAIAGQVAAYLRDGSCLQVGIGRLSEAVLQAAAEYCDLGVHSGMVGDTMLEMMRDGLITNRRKEIDKGLAVAGSVLGSARAVALAADTPQLRVVSIAHTHDPARIGALSNFVCVNSALEVDLHGQVNSETAAGRYVGATGGAVDFLRGSLRGPGGHSIVALPAATGRGRPRVVPRVETVTALATDVDVVVTEHGTAELRGASTAERAGRLIAVAAPEHRDALRQAAAELGL